MCAILAVSWLSGCALGSPIGLNIPSIPGTTPSGSTGRTVGTTGTWAGTGNTGGTPLPKQQPTASPAAPITGNLQARQAAIRPIAERHAAEQGLPVGLVMAVISQESGFNPLAVSPTGAQGLMQLMPGTVSDINARAPKIHVGDPSDADQNVAGGCWYLAWVHRQVPIADVAPGDDWKFALAGYNGGIGRVLGAIAQTRQGDSTPVRVSFDDAAGLLPDETQNYVPSVVARWQTYGDYVASN
jgi:soluble lytic murein transglycosylase-like protein